MSFIFFMFVLRWQISLVHFCASCFCYSRWKLNENLDYNFVVEYNLWFYYAMTYFISHRPHIRDCQFYCHPTTKKSSGKSLKIYLMANQKKENS